MIFPLEFTVIEYTTTRDGISNQTLWWRTLALHAGTRTHGHIILSGRNAVRVVAVPRLEGTRKREGMIKQGDIVLGI